MKPSKKICKFNSSEEFLADLNRGNISEDSIILFNNASENDMEARFQSIITALQSEHCPNNIRFNFVGDVYNDQAADLANALQSGKCRENITINFQSRFENNVVAILGDALLSGKVPAGLCLAGIGIPSKGKDYLKDYLVEAIIPLIDLDVMASEVELVDGKVRPVMHVDAWSRRLNAIRAITCVMPTPSHNVELGHIVIALNLYIALAEEGAPRLVEKDGMQVVVDKAIIKADLQAVINLRDELRTLYKVNLKTLKAQTDFFDSSNDNVPNNDNVNLSSKKYGVSN